MPRGTTRDAGQCGKSSYQLAESVWNAEKQRSEAKILYSFGRADGVDRAQLLRLADSIRRACGAPSKASPAGPSLLEGFKLLPAKAYGGLYVVNALWERVGLREIVGKLKRTRHTGRSTHELALFALVANRLLAPSSKLACYDWVLNNVHFPEGEKLSLHHLYQSMDVLAKKADEVEEAAFWRLADLFSLDVDVIFFDTTTTYFEIDREDGEYEPEPEQPRVALGARRKRGHSKDKRGGNPQVVIALAVTRDGLPVRSWVFPGNTVDVEMVSKVREGLKGMRLTRLLFVGDSGFYSEDNKKILSAGGGRYLRAGAALAEANVLAAEIDRMEKSDLSSRMVTTHKERYQLPLLAAVCILFAEMVVSPARRLREEP